MSFISTVKFNFLVLSPQLKSTFFYHGENRGTILDIEALQRHGTELLGESGIYEIKLAVARGEALSDTQFGVFGECCYSVQVSDLVVADLQRHMLEVDPYSDKQTELGKRALLSINEILKSLRSEAVAGAVVV